MDELKKLLGDDLFNQVSQKLGDKKLFLHNATDKVLIDDGKSFIPYHRFEEVNTKNKQLQEQLKKYEEDIKKMQEDVKGNAELVLKLKELEENNKKFQKEFSEKELLLKKQLALKEALLNEGVTDNEARELLLVKFDLNKIELENDKVKNFSELVKPIKENKTLASLFSTQKFQGKGPNKGTQTPTDFFTREQVEAMSQEEVVANYDKIIQSMKNWE